MKQNIDKKAFTAMDPRIIECVCKHEFQDERYGRGMRVHNPCKQENSTAFRCTVCGMVHEK